jgi:hypothetical protein
VALADRTSDLKVPELQRLPVYIDDIDRMLEQLSSQIPRSTMEMIYLSEIELHKKVYLMLMGIAVLMLIFVVLL